MADTDPVNQESDNKAPVARRALIHSRVAFLVFVVIDTAAGIVRDEVPEDRISEPWDYPDHVGNTSLTPLAVWIIYRFGVTRSPGQKLKPLPWTFGNFGLSLILQAPLETGALGRALSWVGQSGVLQEEAHPIDMAYGSVAAGLFAEGMRRSHNRFVAR